MMPQTTSRRAHSAAYLERLGQRLGKLGFLVTLWDAKGRLVGQSGGGAFCQAIHRAGGTCMATCAAAAERAIQADGPVEALTACGCHLVSLPVRHRRRVTGAVVAGFAVREMAQEPALQQLRLRYALDDEATNDLRDRAWRDSTHAAAEVTSLMTWLIEEGQSLEVAQQEINTLSTNLANTYEELSLLYRISGSMKVTQQPKEFLQQVCNELAEVLNLAGAVAVLRPHRPGEEEDVVVAGDVDLNADQVKLLASAVIGPKLAEDGQPTPDNHFEAPAGSGLGAVIRNYAAAALADDKTTMGVLIGLNKRSGDFDSIDLKLMRSISEQAAVFLANSRLYADLQDLLMGVLHALTASIDAKDPYTCGHSRRVAVMSQRLAESIALPPEKVRRVYLMGLLHDVGKIGVPESVLLKPGRLTEEEFDRMKRHPGVGAEILGGIRQLEDIAVGVLTHHERPDGRGYPRGLAGSEIPIEGLILGLADSFDAMTSNRIYRNALPLPTVIAEIRKHAGTQFAPELVEKLLAMDLKEFLEEGSRTVRASANVARELPSALNAAAVKVEQAS